MELSDKSEYLKELSTTSRQRYVEKVILAGLLKDTWELLLMGYLAVPVVKNWVF